MIPSLKIVSSYKEVCFYTIVFLISIPGSFVSAQPEIIQTKATKCVPGKGPQGPAPEEKCWSGSAADIGSVNEDGKNKGTDNRIEVGLDGKMTVCSKPIPLSKNCRPLRTGFVEYCDHLKGRRECNVLSKAESAGANMTKNLGDLALKSLNPELQKELSARSMAEATREILKSNNEGSGGSYYDPYCMLVPCGGEDDKWRENGARIVTISEDEMTRIVNSSGLDANMKSWSAALQQLDKPAELPIGAAASPYHYSAEGLSKTYFTDSGSAVRLYSQKLELNQSSMPDYGTGAYVAPPMGDSTFRAPTPPSVQIPQADTWAPLNKYVQKIQLPSWMTSAATKVRSWFDI